MYRIRAALTDTTKRLQEYLQDRKNAEQEATWILNHILNYDALQLITKMDTSLTEQQQAKLSDLITQRIEHDKPLAYLLGTVDFCGLKLTVRPPVLIPRLETEEMMAWFIQCVAPQLGTQKIHILDLCTGSGCIALSLAYHMPDANIIGTDICPEALSLANQNKRQLGLSNVTFLASDMFTALSGQTFDFIFSNPPYIGTNETGQLDQSVTKWEAHHALFAPDDGLYFYKQIAQHAQQFLTPATNTHPQLILEIGHTQKEVVSEILEKNRFVTTTHQDLSHKDRWVTANITNGTLS